MPRQQKARNLQTWHEYYSLGTGLLFISILAFVARSFSGGTLIFLMGAYFLFRGSAIRLEWRGSFTEWMGLKALQSLVLTGLGLILMVSLSAGWFGTSFLITALGLLQFLWLKLHTSGHLANRPRK